MARSKPARNFNQQRKQKMSNSVSVDLAKLGQTISNSVAQGVRLGVSGLKEELVASVCAAVQQPKPAVQPTMHVALPPASSSPPATYKPSRPVEPKPSEPAPEPEPEYSESECCASCGTACSDGKMSCACNALAHHPAAGRMTPSQSVIRTCTGLSLVLSNCGGGKIKTSDGYKVVRPGAYISKNAFNCLVAVGEGCVIRKYATGTAVYWSASVGAANIVTGTPALGTRFAFTLRLPPADPVEPSAGLAGLLTIEDAIFFDPIGLPFTPQRVSANGSVWKLREGTDSDQQLHQFGSDGTTPEKLRTTDERCSCAYIYAVTAHEGVVTVIVDTGGILLGACTISGHYVVGAYEELAQHCNPQKGCAQPPWVDILGVQPNSIATTVKSDVF